MIRIDRQKLREGQQATWLVVDVGMILLVLINLSLIVFDWIFASRWVQQFFAAYTPGFHELYAEHVHANFAVIDLAFVSVFIAELLLRWAFAIKNKTYHHWYFYPFVHWYDVLGCIPVGSLRALRLLRVFSLGYRLQKLGVLDLSDTALMRFINYHYEIFMEEVSDRVVLNVLDGVQEELRSGHPLARSLVGQVIEPRKGALVNQIAERVERIIDQTYETNRADIEAYVDRLITRAVARNAYFATLERVPMVGGLVTRQIEQAVSDIVFNVLNDAVSDLRNVESRRVVEEVLDVSFDIVIEERPELDRISTKILLETIDVLKQRVRVQRWKQRDPQQPVAAD